jgi:hypothetical protein
LYTATVLEWIKMSVPIKVDLLPKNKRPGYAMKPEYITIHDTGNASKGADAKAHNKYVHNVAPNPSWHFTVDDREIYQHLPTDTNGWHAGDGVNGVGNRKSIGIEICMNADGNRAQAEANAAWLCAKLIKEIPTLKPFPACMKQHYDWSGKNCPQVIRSRKNGWSGFLAEVQSHLVPAVLTPITGTPQATVAQAQAWAAARSAHQRFIDIAPTYWHYGQLTGIRPEVLYAQAAHETGYGHYGGAVTPDQNNWAGIKVRNPSGDRREDHEFFATPDDGVRAHFNHVCAYVGREPAGTPHDRYYVVKGLSWAGTVRHVEELGGKWAPSPSYGERIVKLLNALLATQAPDEPELPTATRKIGVVVNGRMTGIPGYLINNVTYVPASAIVEIARGQVTGHGDHIRIIF